MRRAGESEIADRIERLVAHELVGEAKPFAIDDAVVADGHGVLERGAKGEPGRPQPLDVLHEAEGAGASQLAAEGAGVEVDLDPLGADQRRVEIDLDVEMETVMRGELAIGAGVFHRDPLQHFEEAARSIELGKADLVDRLDEARGAAVHDRHFGAVDLDQGVVDAETAQRREQMLDRRDRGAVAVAKHGAERHAGHRPLVGGDLGAIGMTVGEKETYAGIAISRTKSDGDWRSAVDPGAGE